MANHSFRVLLLMLPMAGHLSAEVLFRADFETGDLSEWSRTGTRGQNVTPRNIQIVKGTAHSGNHAVKVTIHPDDIFNERQLRAQLGGPRITVTEGSETFLAFSLYMDQAPKDRDNFFYWEGAPPPRYNNVMTWWIEPASSDAAAIRFGTGNLGRNGTLWDARFGIGQWHRLAMHIIWSEDDTKGRIRLWFDGKPALDKVIRTKGAEQVYFCQPGIHRSPHTASVDSIYFDNFVLATSLAEIQAP